MLESSFSESSFGKQVVFKTFMEMNEITDKSIQIIWLPGFFKKMPGLGLEWGWVRVLPHP